MSRMDDIVQYFVECLLNVKNDKPTEIIYNKKNNYPNKYSNLSFEKKYLIHQNVNYYLNKKFCTTNLETNYNKYKI